MSSQITLEKKTIMQFDVQPTTQNILHYHQHICRCFTKGNMIFPKLFVSCTEIKGDNNNIKQQIDGQAKTFVSDGSPGRESAVLKMCLPIPKAKIGL